MKVNAPEKIYIDGCSSFACETNDDNIEYVRTDAFIEKACEWLNDNANKYWGTEFVDSGEMVEEFRKYMEK